MRRRSTEDRKKWTSLDTLRLISEFESMPFLWNVFDEEYKNKRLKSKAIEKLARFFETSPREIHRKLHNLRCQYTSEIRKIRSRGSAGHAGPPERPASQWSYFESLKFLSAVVNVRAPGGNDAGPPTMCFEPGRYEPGRYDPGRYEPGRYDPGRPDVPAFPGDHYPTMVEQEEDASGSREMKFNPLELDLMRKRSEDSNSEYDTKPEIIKLDDFDIFGKLVASHLRKMPVDRAIRCQEKLFTVIMQERLADNDDPTALAYEGMPPYPAPTPGPT